jgi:hypothetical protein
MTNSDQIKEAPAPIGDSKQIFQRFTDATAALLDCPGAPEDVREEVLKMVEALGDEHDGDDACDGDLARKVLMRVFDLAGTDAADFDDDCIRDAAAKLANAFATIEEHRRFMPVKVYNLIADAIQEFYDLAEWQSDHEVLRKVLPHIVEAAILNSDDE